MHHSAGRTRDKRLCDDPDVDRIENDCHSLEGLMPQRREYDENEPNVYSDYKKLKP